ncbi:MAG: flagellar FliJ family protein [Actinomycetes bacterium]
MSKRAFRLASLLRLRRAQEDQASAELARAAAERLKASERADRQRQELASHRTPAACSPAGWTASIAARAALSAATRQAAVDVEQASARVDVATEAWRVRRRETKALEHLEQRHREQTTQQLLEEEQLRIDEHTSAIRRQHPAGRTSDGQEERP